MRNHKRVYVIILLIWGIIPTLNAQDTTLNINGGGTSSWFITGEASLVINGFSMENFERPTMITGLSLDVEKATPGQSIDAVIYQDANGGSPIDAELVGRTQVNITQAGVFTVSFDDPIEISSSVIWAGFYLPIDFEFRADTSGTSVLTYWAWTPESRFDVANLSSASVLGPGDGSAPVNIDMGGIAKITISLDTNGTVSASENTTEDTTKRNTNTPITHQPKTTDVLVRYKICDTLYYDRLDIGITYRSSFRTGCTITQNNLRLEAPPGYAQRGPIYDIIRFGKLANVTLPTGVTHCIVPPTGDLNNAVLGLAAGSPRRWEILPSARFDQFVCAEIHDSGYISYFVPAS